MCALRGRDRVGHRDHTHTSGRDGSPQGAPASSPAAARFARRKRAGGCPPHYSTAKPPDRGTTLPNHRRRSCATSRMALFENPFRIAWMAVQADASYTSRAIASDIQEPSHRTIPLATSASSGVATPRYRIATIRITSGRNWRTTPGSPIRSRHLSSVERGRAIVRESCAFRALQARRAVAVDYRASSEAGRRHWRSGRASASSF